jgi:hypothetical protein
LSEDLSFYFYDQTIRKYLGCKSLWFSMELDALETIAVPEGWWSHRPMTFRRRLDEIRDLTHIDLVYEDGTNLYISVPYYFEENSPFYAPNVWQKPGKVQHHKHREGSIYNLYIRDPFFLDPMEPRKKRDPMKKYRRMTRVRR